jgi:PAS domain S-box-containing protein
VHEKWNSPLESGLEERERFYRALVEQTRDFITVVGRDGTILFKNRSNDHPAGYSAAELVGCNVFDFIHHDDLGRVRAAFDRALAGVPTSAVEHRFRYKDGSWRVFESIGHYAFDFPFGPIAIITSRDITERKSLEAQFRQVQRIEMIGRMTTRVAHVLLEQVIVNLVVNAREAMPAGGLITVATSSVRSAVVADSAHVVLSVADTGIGMTPEVKSRIFDPFFGTKTKDSNSGLGLTTVAGIVSQAGGRIDVDSEEGAGSTFHVTLPAHPSMDHDGLE